MMCSGSAIVSKRNEQDHGGKEHGACSSSGYHQAVKVQQNLVLENRDNIVPKQIIYNSLFISNPEFGCLYLRKL